MTKAELEAKNAELQAQLASFEAKNAELQAQLASLEAKNAELQEGGRWQKM